MQTAWGTGYSYRNASIGSKRDALLAGDIPKMTPISILNSTPIQTTCQETSDGQPAIRETSDAPRSRDRFRLSRRLM